MYISVRKKWWKKVRIQMLIVIVTAAFGMIYEYFGHGVHSAFMGYGFMVPLILGVIPYGIYMIYGKIDANDQAIALWNCGIMTLTVGSLFMGVLEIYGTTNRITVIYLIAGIFMLILGLTRWIFYLKYSHRIP